MQRSEKIKGYTALVCEQIRWKKAHGFISEEIENHIIDHTDVLVESGMDEESATDKAIMEMGDPVIVGSQLDRTHRPKMDWGVIALMVLTLFIGFFIRIFIKIDPAGKVYYIKNNSIGESMLITAIGFACMIIFYSVDFTIIGKYPKRIFGFFLAISVGVISLTHNNVNTASIYWSSTIRYQYIMLLLPTAFAGILYCMRNKRYLGILISGVWFALPAMIGVISDNIASAFYYAVTCLILLTYAILKGWFNVKRLYGICLVYCSIFIVSPCILNFLGFNPVNGFTETYRSMRFKAFLNPLSETMTINTFIRDMIQGAKFIGQGEFLSESNWVLPNIDTDYLLTYLIDRFGFISLVIIMMVLLTFILRLIFLSKKQKSVLGKIISMAIIITFSVQITVYLASNFGVLILSTLPLPFIAYDGWATIANMILMGIILSVFKSGSIVKDGFEVSNELKRKFI